MARLLDLNLQCVPPRALPSWLKRSLLPGQPRNTMWVRPARDWGRAGGAAWGRSECGKSGLQREAGRGADKGRQQGRGYMWSRRRNQESLLTTRDPMHFLQLDSRESSQ